MGNFCIWTKAANSMQTVKKVDSTTALKDNGMKLKGAYKAAFVLCNRMKQLGNFLMFGIAVKIAIFE